MRTKTLKKHKIASLSLLGLLLLFGISQGLYRWKFAGESSAQVEAALAVQTVRVKTLSMPTAIETVGSLFSLNEAKLKTAGSGKVERILLESGTFAKKGTQLIEIIGGPEVRAPFDGYLTDWKVKVGEFISGGTELIDLVDTSLLSLHYRIPEHYAPQLEVGQEVTLSVRAFPNQEFKGAVTYISPVIDKKTHTVLLHAKVKNSDQDLWPGMTARVSHGLVEEPNALVIPESSLILTLEGYEVLVVRQGKLVRSPVQIGTRRQGRVQILSGLKQEESVLLTHKQEAKEGVSVIPQDWPGVW